MGESEIEIEIDVIKNTNNTREWPLFGNGKPKTKQNTATWREDEKKTPSKKMKKRKEKRNHQNYIVTHLRFVCDSPMFE